MSRAEFIVGDVFDVMSTLKDESVDMVMTSPPFLALRSYLPADHPDKDREIGSEPSPAEFLDTLLALTAEWDRVLAPHGSICVELGDTYSGSGGAGGDYSPDGLRAGQGKFEGSNARRGKVVDRDSGRRNPGAGWPMAKSMCGIPHLYHLSLAYGRNLLTGEASPAGMWRVRNVVAWCRPNPPVGALGDKFRPATSYMTIATKAGDRYFDLDAVRAEFSEATIKSDGYSRNSAKFEERQDSANGRPGVRTNKMTHAGAPPLDWWEIPTAPYKGSHYAVFPPALLERPIKSMCPMQVCTVCGEPRRRIVQPTEWPQRTTDPLINDGGSGVHGERCANPTTLGWTDCGHDSFRNGIVLDPFGGSGTTAQVATGLGRDALLIDIDERNADLARDRVGMFLTVTETRCAPPVQGVAVNPTRGTNA